VAIDIFSNLRWREPMSLPRLWTRSQELTPDAFRAMRREMANAFRAFEQNSSSPDIGAGAPAISVAETNDALEVTAAPRRGRERYQGQPGRQPADHFR
jgi:hypothetical protein